MCVHRIRDRPAASYECIEVGRVGVSIFDRDGRTTELHDDVHRPIGRGHFTLTPRASAHSFEQYLSCLSFFTFLGGMAFSRFSRAVVLCHR